ncbi:unnamed protein product, partial [Medioppia subpectinata]
MNIWQPLTLSHTTHPYTPVLVVVDASHAFCAPIVNKLLAAFVSKDSAIFKTRQNSSSTDNDLAFTSQDLNDLAIRIGADLGLPDINDIHVGEESVNHDMLANVDQSQG